MFAYFWPLVLVVTANVFYNISSRSVPKACDAFMALVCTYATAFIFSLFGFLVTGGARNFLPALKQTNWACFLLGFSMIGLEVGMIYMYRAGWKMSSACLAVNAVSAALLVLVGCLFFGEHLTLRQIAGMVVTMAGLALSWETVRRPFHTPLSGRVRALRRVPPLCASDPLACRGAFCPVRERFPV